MRFSKGGGVSWSKADRERAKREGKKLFVIGFEEPGADGEHTIYMGVGDDELVKRVGKLLAEEILREKETPRHDEEAPGVDAWKDARHAEAKVASVLDTLDFVTGRRA